MALPLALFAVLLCGLLKGRAAFETQTWTYNATLFWAPIFEMHPRHGHQLAALAEQLTHLTFGLVEAIRLACVEPSSNCPGGGQCDQEAMVVVLNERQWLFQSTVDGVIEQLADDAGVHGTARALQAATAALGAVAGCEELARGLAASVPDSPGCAPLVVEALSCSRGLSDVSRVTMAELHAAQIAAVAVPRSLAGVGAPRPDGTVFTASRGLERSDILASFLLEALGAGQSQGGGDGDGGTHLELRSGPFVAQVLAAEIGVNDGKTSEALLEKVPGLRLLLVDPFEFAHKDYIDANPHMPSARGENLADALWDRMRPYRNRSVIVCQRSADAAAWVAPDSLDLVFIDGDHDYDAVREDFGMWRPKLRVGGVLAGHDYSLFFPGTVRAAHEFALSARSTLFLGPDHMWWFQL